MGQIHQLRPLPPAPPLQVNGVGRVVHSADAHQGDRVLEVYFTRRPTDDEVRAFHEWTREFNGLREGKE